MQVWSRSRCVLSSLAVALLSSISLISASVDAAALPPGFTIGSANVAVADPAVPRPPTQPCTVTLFNNQAFADYNSHSFNYTPPAACPKPWAKVVLQVDLSVTAGNQFDRTAHIWLAGTNIYTGTTEEPSAKVGPNWHVERDITDYAALLSAPQSGNVDLGNTVNSTYTGILYGTATLQIYPAVAGVVPPRTPDVVYPLSASATGGVAVLNTSTDQLVQTINFPRNVERAFIDVLAQGQSGDEFWYSCVPSNLASQLGSCGNTSFREAEISIDGQPAGVAPVYPWIFTGGVDPLLWRPTPGVQTLNLLPYRVDISPFAGLLSNGQPHKVGISVYNANSYFYASGAVLVYLDPQSIQITGAITSNSLAALAAPVIANQLVTDAQGNTTGTLITSSKRSYTIAGYIQTTRGHVRMSVKQSMDFQNAQTFNIPANGSSYVQNISQNTTVDTETSIAGHGQDVHEHHWQSYPMTMNMNSSTPAGQAQSQTTQVSQAYKAVNKLELDGFPLYRSEVSNSVTPSDTIQFDAHGNFTGSTGQQSVQTYRFTDSTGACYKRTVSSKAGLLTTVSDGNGCRGGQDNVWWFIDPYGIALPDLSILNMYR